MPAGRLIRTLVAAGLGIGLAGAAMAQDVVKIGMILPMTGPFASTGRQIEAAAKLYMQQNGSTVAGKKIELIVKDDAGIADTTKRIAQELIVNDKVAFLAGFGLTPLALATAPLATEAKVPMVVMAAATSVITEKSPYIVRTGLHAAAGDDADRRLGGQERASDPSSRWFPTTARASTPRRVHQDRFTGRGRQGRWPNCASRCAIRTSRRSCSACADAKPDAVFVFVPSGVGAIFMKQFAERGLDKGGIRLIGTGDVTDDDILNDMGDVALGVITSFHYSAAHESAVNKAYVDAFRKANNDHAPQFSWRRRLRRHAASSTTRWKRRRAIRTATR